MEILFEYAQATRSVRVDQAACVIHDVKIIGTESRNGRRYPRATLAKARGLYEGKQVNVDHRPRENPDADRSVTSRFGWLANVRATESGLYGDLHYLEKHPVAAQVVEMARRNPSLLGLSHDAEGTLRRENGSTIVEEITRVHSVDLVSDPAATSSLFESVESGTDAGPPGAPMQTMGDINQALQNFAKAILKLLDNPNLDDATKLGAVAEMAQRRANAPLDADLPPSARESLRRMVWATLRESCVSPRRKVAKIREQAERALRWRDVPRGACRGLVKPSLAAAGAAASGLAESRRIREAVKPGCTRLVK